MSSAPADLKRTVEKANDAFANANTEAFLDLCTDDVTWTMVGDVTVSGKEAVRAWMAGMNSNPPAFTVEWIAADGNIAVAHGSMTMKDQDAQESRYAYCDIYQFREGLISELRAFVVKTSDVQPG